MCGIAGWVDFEGRDPPTLEGLSRMAGVIAHRGPDDQGVHLAGMAGLAARRLAIVDLAGGHQPIANEDGSVWVAFNGEIYNHAELRAKLVEQGHVFRTRCDTEVLVHLYEQHGDEFPTLLEGQFAVAIWDSRRQRLLAVRDRLGVRPLFYFQRGSLFQCASEIKALLAGGRLTARLDPRGLDHIITYMFQIDERTLFAGVKSLPPGHVLIADRSGVRTREFWDLDFPAARDDRPVSERECDRLADELDDLLGRAVRLRMSEEVPFATYLSGGVDSSLIAKLVNDGSAEPVPTFTATFRKAFFNERREAAAYARRLGSRAVFVDCHRERLADDFPAVIWHAETPMIDTSCAATFALARAVRAAGFKVVLTGEGADEALAGYIYFKIEKLRRMLSGGVAGWFAPLLARLQRRWLGTTYLFPDAAQIALAQRSFGCVPDRWDEFWFLRGLRGLLSREVLAELGDWTAFDDVPARWRSRVAGRHPLNQSLYLAYRMRLGGALLSEKGDRMSMAHSVEGRYPYLDTRVVEFCARLPTAAKLRGWQEKYLLRRVAERHIPASVAWRYKKMLMAPFSELFLEGGSGGSAHATAELLSPAAVRAAGILDPVKIEQLVSGYRQMRGFRPEGVLHDLGLVFAAGVQLWHHLFIAGRSLPGVPGMTSLPGMARASPLSGPAATA